MCHEGITPRKFLKRHAARIEELPDTNGRPTVDPQSSKPTRDGRQPMRLTASLFVWLFCGLLATASGQPPEELRPWTDASGRYRIQARFVRVVGDYVELIKNDGKTISLPLGRLSKEDRDFAVANLRQIDAALNSKLQLSFLGGTLPDALNAISQASQVRFLIDQTRLTQEGKSFSGPIEIFQKSRPKPIA